MIGGDHDFSDPSKPVLEQTRTSAGVTIGAGVWMGAGAKILDGVTIGDHAVIGAGSVVRDDVEAHAIAVGIPARVVSTRHSRQSTVDSRQLTASRIHLTDGTRASGGL